MIRFGILRKLTETANCDHLISIQGDDHEKEDLRFRSWSMSFDSAGLCPRRGQYQHKWVAGLAFLLHNYRIATWHAD
jgi:hypothetical protein